MVRVTGAGVVGGTAVAAGGAVGAGAVVGVAPQAVRARERPTSTEIVIENNFLFISSSFLSKGWILDNWIFGDFFFGARTHCIRVPCLYGWFQFLLPKSRPGLTEHSSGF